MDIQNVMVPFDFSPTSRFAVDQAVSIARTFRARLTLLHVVEFPSMLSTIFPTETDKSGKERCAQARKLLSSMLGPEDQDDLDLQIRVRFGEIHNEIRTAISEEHVSLVVMGTHSRGLVRRIFLGSVTQDLLRKMPVPVVTVSHDAHPMTFSRILFATSLSATYREELEFVLNFVRKTNAELVVFHSIEPLSVTFSDTDPITDIEFERKRLREVARQKLALLESDCVGLNIRVRTEMTEGPVAEQVLTAAERFASDLIILTVQDKSMVERVLLGSTVERVVRDAPVPVLSVPINIDPKQDSTVELNMDSPVFLL